MSDLSANQNLAGGRTPEILYCYKCGSKLPENSYQCTACGTTVDYNHSEKDAKFTDQKLKPKKNQTTKKIILFSVSGVILLSVAILAVFFLKTGEPAQDINSINGCPEFYNIEFGMTADEASKQIKLRHKVSYGIKGLTNDSSILFDKGEVFELFGRKTSDVHIGFKEKYMDSVLFIFAKDDYDLEDIVSVYTKIYGPANKTGTTYSTWNGSKTTIDVFEYISDAGEGKIIVRYLITPNSRYTALSFNGSEIDPCGFLSENYAFDKSPDYYINGLIEGFDYDKTVYTPEGFSGFSQYTLYPEFEYMGIEKGYTAIEFSKDEDENNIGLVSYKFLLDDKNAVDRMTYMHNKLVEIYGTADSSTYTSTYYDEMGVTDVKFNEMIDRISEDTEGIYNIQWKSNGLNITLSLTINVYKEYYEGSVSFSD